MSEKISLVKPIPKFEVVHAYDPGGTTGYARVRIDYKRGAIDVEQVGMFRTWSLLDDHFKKIDNQRECVVYEEFQLRTVAANLIPVEVIGVLKYLCYNVYRIQNYKQPAYIQNGGKSGTPVEKWYPVLKKFSSHPASALKHAVYFSTAKLCSQQIQKLNCNHGELMRNFLTD